MSSLTLPNSLADLLLHTQAIALRRLAALLESAKSEREVRLACLAILRFKWSNSAVATAASPPTRTAAPTALKSDTGAHPQAGPQASNTQTLCPLPRVADRDPHQCIPNNAHTPHDFHSASAQWLQSPSVLNALLPLSSPLEQVPARGQTRCIVNSTSHHPIAREAPEQTARPLQPDELQTLATLLPHVKPSRFTSKHTPAHWRDVIARNQRISTSPPQDSAPRTKDSPLLPGAPEKVPRTAA